MVLHVVRSTSEEPVEVYWRNRRTRAELNVSMAQFDAQFGHKPIIVHHPEGSCCIGVEPLSFDELSSPPQGWRADHVRGILMPDRTTSCGVAAWSAMTRLAWDWKPLPGLHGPEAPAGLVRLQPLDVPHVLNTPTLLREGLIEVDGTLWAVVEWERAKVAQQSGLWVKSRRSELIAALSVKSMTASGEDRALAVFQSVS